MDTVSNHQFRINIKMIRINLDPQNWLRPTCNLQFLSKHFLCFSSTDTERPQIMPLNFHKKGASSNQILEETSWKESWVRTSTVKGSSPVKKKPCKVSCPVKYNSYNLGYSKTKSIKAETIHRVNKHFIYNLQ